MPAYMPTVNVNGTNVSPNFSDLETPVVLAELTHQWGRSELYDPNEPGQLAFDILDPTGEFVGSGDLYQAPVTVTLATVGMTFRGTVDQVTIKRASWTMPGSGVRQTGWRAHITATDMLASLAKTTTPGIPIDTNVDNDAFTRSQLGDGYWRASGNVDDINTAITKAGLDVVVKWAPISEGNFSAAISVGDDLYQRVITAYARASDFPRNARYKASDKTVISGTLAAPGTVVLQYASSVISTKPSSSSARSVPANTVEVDPDASVESALTHNISSIRVYSYCVSDLGRVEFQGPSQSAPSVWGEKPTESPLDFPVPGVKGANQLNSQAKISWPFGEPCEDPTEYANRCIPIIQTLNGRLYSPPLTFDLERFTYPAAVATELVGGILTDNAWTFPGSIYEPLPGYGPFFQLIGVTATYDDGWKVTGVFAPARDSGGSGIPINTLVTSATPTFNQYAEHITLATLGTVSGGI